MVIQVINDTKILMLFTHKEAKRYFVDFDNSYNSSDISQVNLNRLLLLAKLNTGFNINNRDFLFEIVEEKSGFIIMITAKEKKDNPKRKKFRIKQDPNNRITHKGEIRTINCLLGTSEILLNLIKKVYKLKCAKKVVIKNSDLYRIKNYYFLITVTDREGFKILSPLISEYNMNKNPDSNNIFEYGELLCKNDAISYIGKYL